MRKASNPNYVKFGPTEMVVTFTADRGQLRRNDSGEYFLRDIVDGKFTCASPDLERQLIDARVRAGQQVGITRKTYNRCAVWTVRPIGQVTTIAASPREATAKPKPKTHDLPERLYAKPGPVLNGNGKPSLVASPDGQLVAAPVPPEPPAPAFPECEQPATAPAEQAKPDSPTLITRCMLAAVDAAAKATAHGQEIGFPVTFGAPEIEAIAVTLYIRAQDTLGGYRKPNNKARSHYQNGNAGERA